MQTPIFDAALRQLAVASISGYQKHISPIKGFSCVTECSTGGTLSQYIKGAIAKLGLFGAIKASRHRSACKGAKSNLESPGLAVNLAVNLAVTTPISRVTMNQNPIDPNLRGELLAEALRVKITVLKGVDRSGADCSGLDLAARIVLGLL